MIDVRSVLDRVGPALLRTIVAGPTGVCVNDVVIPEPGRDSPITSGDVVLGIGVESPGRAVELAHHCGDHQAVALLLKPPVSTDEAVADVAAGRGFALVEVSADAAWAQLVWVIRAALASSAAPEIDSRVPGRSGSAGLGDLFRLADAVADVVDAPVTIEDAHSQVLAYSARQDLTDPARVSTIMGRRQPDEVLAKFRARGTFRELSKGRSAIFVPAQGDGTLPRLVMPIRMGGELLGSMWAVVPCEVSAERSAAFADTAPLVALQLMRWRAVADAERQRSAELVQVLLGGEDGWRAAATELAASSGDHRVVALDARGAEGVAEGHRLAMWEWIVRGIGRRPLVTEIGDVLYALVPDDDGAGGWVRLRKALAEHSVDPAPLVAVGTAVGLGDLARSRAEADEVLGLLRSGRLTHRVGVHDELWQVLVLERTADACLDAGVGALGPLPLLRSHDEAQGTEYLRTLHAWLRHPGDPRTASGELRVHPNTFRYRMKRLTTIVDVDLDDPDVRAALLVQLLAQRRAHGAER